MNKKAFTLVELIVVITILAILATVGFVSFQGYSQSSRDSVRLADISSAEKVINLYRLTNSRYPTPNDGKSITYSGSTAWTQGTFGQNAYTSNTSLSNVPTDPLIGLPYAYSVTNTKQEYQMAAVLEGEVSQFNNQTYAGDQITKAYVRGNYNGQFVKVSANSTNYLLGVPSIIASDITSVDMIDIINNQRLVYKGYNNLPASFSGSQYNNNGGFNFTPNGVILFEGDIGDLENNKLIRADFLQNLQESYLGSLIKNEERIKKLLSININTTNPSIKSQNYASNLINNTLGTKIKILVDNNSEPTVLPDVVTGLVSLNRNESSFSLSWNSANNATSYGIYINSSYVGDVNTTSTVLNGFTENTTYNVTVISKNVIGDAAASSSLAVTTAPLPVSDLTALGANENQIGIQWTPVTGATGYAIFRDNNFIGSTADTSVTLTGLSPNTSYNIYLLSLGLNPAFSNPSNILTFKTAPVAPNDISAVHISNDSVDMSWTAVPGAIGYAIFRGSTYLGNTTQNRVTDFPIPESTAYSYTIRSLASGTVYSNPSNVFNATTAATTLGPIQNFTNTAIGSTTADFSFDILPGVDHYINYINGYYMGESVDGNVNLLNMSDLEPNTTYNISINAIDAGGGFGTRQSITITTNP